MTDERWLEEQSAGAPAPLRERAAEYLGEANRANKANKANRADDSEPLSTQLARAARQALEAVLAHPGKGDRSVALDLLTADALVTMALKAKAAESPGELARFAAELRGQGSGVRGQEGERAR